MARWNNQWKVDSSSSPGKTYTVSEAYDGSWACSCPAWTRMRKECRHVKMVKGRLAAGVTDKAIVQVTAGGKPVIPGAVNDIKPLSSRNLEALVQAVKDNGEVELPKPAKQLSLLERLATEAPWRMK